MQRALVDFGADQSFGKAADKVQEHYGFQYNVSAVRESTLKCAARVADQLEAEAAKDYRLLPTTHARTVIAEADGSMLCTVFSGPRRGKRPRKWEEIRLAAAQLQGEQQSVYAASFGSVKELGRRWGHCAKAAGRQLHSRVHCLGDGAEWIEQQSQAIFGSRGRYLCDYYHVSQYLAAAAERCRPKAPHRWRRTQQKRLKRGAYQLVIQELELHREADSTPAQEAPVRAAERYLKNRVDQLDYAGALAQKLPIGSGMIESGHKHVLQGRLKLSGAAWLKENAHSMAQLRVLRANRRWEQIWN